MVEGKILQFYRYPDGSLQALFTYQKPVNVTRDMSFPKPAEGVSAAEHEKAFFAKILAEAQVDIGAAMADVSDIEGKKFSELPK